MGPSASTRGRSTFRPEGNCYSKREHGSGERRLSWEPEAEWFSDVGPLPRLARDRDWKSTGTLLRLTYPCVDKRRSCSPTAPPQDHDSACVRQVRARPAPSKLPSLPGPVVRPPHGVGQFGTGAKNSGAVIPGAPEQIPQQVLGSPAALWAANHRPGRVAGFHSCPPDPSRRHAARKARCAACTSSSALRRVMPSSAAISRSVASGTTSR